ncbi:MAG: HEAT repeat domain-containing protein [Candidatus Solibacter sp.]
MTAGQSDLAAGALYAAAALIAVLLLLLGLLLLAAMAVSAYVRSRRAASAALRPHLHTALIEFLGGATSADIFRSHLRNHRTDLVDSIRLFQSTVGGSARERLCSLALELGLVAEWCGAARARDVAKRRSAFLNLSFASAYEPCRDLAGDLLIAGLQDADEEVRLYACRALLAAGAEQHVETIFSLAIKPNLLTRIVLTEDLRRYASALAAGPARAALRSGEAQPMRASLEILVAWERAIEFEDIRDFLEHRDREVRILAFRMAGFTTVNARSRHALVRCMKDPDLVIRALAITSVGRQKMTEAIPELARCLRCEALEEARLAAAALAEMPPLGWRTLEELSASNNSATALAAREALARARSSA